MDRTALGGVQGRGIPTGQVAGHSGSRAQGLIPGRGLDEVSPPSGSIALEAQGCIFFTLLQIA